jgi:hypothetical protein
MMKDVHKHEKAMHPGQPLTKLAKGGKAYKKGGPTTDDRMKMGRNMSRAMNQKSG